MKLKLMLISILILCTSCAGVSKRTNENGTADYFHVGLGAVGYAVTYSLLPDDMPKWAKCTTAFTVVVGASVLKEHLYDKNAEWKDTAGFAAGAFFMIPVMEW
jgi:uncharacterized membrane protein YfcA